MMIELAFTKMQGLGNDFVVVDDLFESATQGHPLRSWDAQRICDRRFGVGADQILWLKQALSHSCDARMEILNADGSTAEMCGNGIRAVALYLKDRSLEKKDEYTIETLAGLMRVHVQGDEVRVDMGVPQFSRAGFCAEKIQAADRTFEFYDVNMGNPHAVIFVEDVDVIPLEGYGPILEKHPRFPQRTNVEFVQVLSPHSIRVRVWERGAGVTLACGTGACASAVATLASQRGEGELDVLLPGGRLKVSWLGSKHSVFMTGPAARVYRGVYDWSIESRSSAGNQS